MELRIPGWVMDLNSCIFKTILYSKKLLSTTPRVHTTHLTNIYSYNLGNSKVSKYNHNRLGRAKQVASMVVATGEAYKAYLQKVC
jgi:hypothetical protein